jgi:hypothetical protein
VAYSEAPRQKRSKATNPALVPGWNKTAVTPVKTSGSGRASPLPAVSAFESEEQAGNQFANVKDNVAGGLKQRRTNQVWRPNILVELLVLTQHRM